VAKKTAVRGSAANAALDVAAKRLVAQKKSAPKKSVRNTAVAKSAATGNTKAQRDADKPAAKPAAGKTAVPPSTPKDQQAPDTTATPERDHDSAAGQQPAATFDPTPDTVVPPRGQTSFHGAQSERAAAAKGQRARQNQRRKY
jgi:hypothetical protein